MQKKLQLVSSGISLIDEGWGGLYKGSNYLLIGAHKSGKTNFGLNFVLEGAAQKERCLYFTSKSDQDLFNLAVWMNLDLQIVYRPKTYHNRKDISTRSEFSECKFRPGTCRIF